MVFGARLAEAVAAGRDGPVSSGVMAGLVAGDAPGASGADAPVVRCVDVDAVASEWAVAHAVWPGAAPAGAEVTGDDSEVAKLRDRLQRAMTEGAGVLRSPASLAAACTEVSAVADALGGSGTRPSTGELANLVTVSGALLRAAWARAETRGAHARRDHPHTVAQWQRRIVHRRAVVPTGSPSSPSPRRIP
jgi:succinate dehydrogenase/fumarate reductase flavoprotein subunit